MIRLTLLMAVALLLLEGASLRADPLQAMSHRDKLYTLAARGDAVFAVGYPGRLLFSPDRGRTWQLLDAGTRDALFGVDLAKDGRGVIAGRTGLLLTTADGGKSWSRVTVPVQEHLFGVSLKGDHAWAVGNFGTILHSSDGGKTWAKQEYDASLPADAGEPGRGGAPAGAGEDDTGEPSSAEEENEGAVEEARLNAVSFADERRGWIVGEFGLILATEDGGTSWKRQLNPSGKLLLAVVAIDAQRVLAAGSEGTLLETRDGGRIWRLVATGVQEHLLGLWVQGQRLVLVGRDGLILQRDGEEGAFARAKASLYTWLSGVVFLDERLGFACGGRGHLLQTDDGGATWKRLSGR